MNPAQLITRVGFGAIVLLILSVGFGSFYTIDAGERGVILRNGKYAATAEPGLNFKMPFIDDVKTIDVRDGVRVYEGLMAYSKDQQTATMKVTVNYRVIAEDVNKVYVDYGSVDAMLARIMDPKVAESTKEVFGAFNAVSAIQERGRLGIEVEDAIIGSVKGPIVIVSIQVENIDFSDVYEASIEARMLAEVAVQTKEQDKKKEVVEADITIIRAQAVATSQLAQATAEAEAIRLKGNAEAEAIKARAAALAKNPELVELTKAERWDGVLPTSMIPGSVIPFLELGK